MSKVEAYLKISDVARYAGLTVDGVKDLIEEGELSALELNGQLKVRKSEVDRWLDEQVDPKHLLELTEKIEEEISSEKIASALDMDKDEIEKLKENMND